MSDFERILTDAAIEDVIGQYVPLKKTGSTLAACCPFHAEKTPSFKVNPSTQSYACYGCGVGGDAVDFLRAYLGVGPFEALTMIASGAGLPLPERRKKSDLLIAKEDAVAALWEACSVPTAGLGKKLIDFGWSTRIYDAELLESAGHSLGAMFEEVSRCGLAHVEHHGPLSSASFKPLENAWVIAGQRLVGSGPIVTGFIVVTEGSNMLLAAQRLTSASSPACLIINQASIANRLRGPAAIFITDNPLRAIQLNRRFIGISPAAAQWRPQDVRNVRQAFPNATFVLDFKHISDQSFLEWAAQTGEDSTELMGIEDTGDPTQVPIPALTHYITKVSSQFLQAGQNGSDRIAGVMRATDTANALLDSLITPEIKLLAGLEFAAAGVPVTYAVNVSETAPAAPRPLQTLASLKSVKYATSGASVHLLESALLHLPYVDAEMWASIPADEFGGHAPMATTIAQFLKDRGMSGIAPARAHAAFWTYVERFSEEPVPPSLLDFWQTRLSQSPEYWEKLPAADSFDGRSYTSEMTAALVYFRSRIDKRRRLDLAQTAQIDSAAADLLREAYTSRD